MPAVSHQKKIRDEMMAKDPRPVMKSLKDCYVKEASYIEERGIDEYFSYPDRFATDLILTYEWLGTLPKIPRWCGTYGLYDPSYSREKPIGVSMFGYGSGTLARNVCGTEYADKAICLERGASVHWAHPHAASFLISRACKIMADYGYRIFYAYSDVEAGEIGTVYQACNWHYIGRADTARKDYFPPKYNPCMAPHNWIDDRERRRIKKNFNCGHSPKQHREMGWLERKAISKHRYVRFEGNRREKRKFREALQYAVLPYPKRELPAPSG